MSSTARQPNRRGNALYSVATMLAMCGFGALAVDIGHARMVRAELQRAADAGAQAGAAYLDGTDAGCASAAKAALWYANSNGVDGASAQFDQGSLSFGFENDSGTYSLGGRCDASSTVLRVEKSVDSISAIFAPIAFGVNRMGASARATVMRPPPTGASAVNCFLPVAVPQCSITGPGTFNFRRSSNGVDTAGWASLGSASASASFFKAQLSGRACIGASVSDMANLQNGNTMSAEAVAKDRINHRTTSTGVSLDLPDAWPADEWGLPSSSSAMSGSKILSRYFGKFGIGGPVMLITAGDKNGNGVDDLCDPNPPNYTGQMRIAGFAYGMIYDVASGDIAIQVDTEHDASEFVTAGGGTNPYGMTHQAAPTLVE